MAWTCTGRSNRELVDNMREAGLIKSDRVAKAMSKTDRKHYVPEKSSAYQDSPQPIGYNATISAPHMHAHALEDLEEYIRPGMRVLDVGCGSGYLTAVIHNMIASPQARKGGVVVGVDHLPGLTDLSRRNLKNDGIELSEGSGIEIVTGDGRKGWPSQAPYDAIHVGAAAPTLPQALVDQLNTPGRMFIPVGTREQAIWRVDKDKDGNVTKEELFGVRVSKVVGALPATVGGMIWLQEVREIATYGGVKPRGGIGPQKLRFEITRSCGSMRNHVLL